VPRSRVSRCASIPSASRPKASTRWSTPASPRATSAWTHEYYLKREDILTAIAVIATRYDEPFANESAVPAYFCARMAAADGYRVILAGDGGDEIFSGNAH